MKQWRYTITDNHRPIIKQASGDGESLSDVMNEIQQKINIK